MTKLLHYPTVVGTFYICKDVDGLYHTCIEEELLGSYETLVDAIEGIAYDTSVILPHPEMGDPLDPTDLGVPDDISGWRPLE
jgi:hypothetical protein